jgi:CHAT domain-containing protein/tetratricopeptide (TPR) repeat protein
MERLADLGVLFGHFDPAADLLEAVRTLFARSGNSYSADFTGVKVASLRIARGEIREAQEILSDLQGAPSDLEGVDFTEPLARWEAGHRWDGSRAEICLMFSRLYLEMARLLAALGRFSCSRLVAERGLHHVEKSGLDIARPAEPALQMAVATANLQSGALSEARGLLETVRGGTVQTSAVGHRVRRDELLGKLSLFEGNLGEAKECFERVVQLCRAQGFRAAEATAALNLAHVLILLNQTRTAADLVEAVRAWATAPQFGGMRLRANLLAAVAEERARSYADGPSLASSVYGLWTGDEPQLPGTDGGFGPAVWGDPPASADYLLWFEDSALNFQLRLAYTGLRSAADSLRGIDHQFGDTDSPLIGALRANLHATLLYYQGAHEQALISFKRVRKALSRMGAKSPLWQVLRFISWSEARLGRLEESSRCRAEADRLLESMTGTLPIVDRAIFNLNKWTAEEEYLAGESQQLWQTRRQAAGKPVRGWLVRLRQMPRILSLIGYLDRYRSEIGQRQAGAPPAATRPHRGKLLVWLLKHGWRNATIRFVVLPDRVIQISARGLFIDLTVSPLSRILVRQRIADWHKSIIELRPDEAQVAMRRIAGDLGIEQALHKLPKRVRQISFVPDDALHGLPFAALQFGGGYLVQRFAVTIDFKACQPSGSADSNGRALVAAVTDGDPQYPQLPAASSERELVTEILERQGVSTDSQVSPARETIVDALSRYRFFHIICHGAFRPDAPDESGFVLVRGSQVQILSLREVHRLDLRGLEQAVLASCWSADNFVLPGRWIISLPEALRNAGARSVLGCLWEVDDRVAPEFHASFYRKLSEMPRAEALRQTQLDCIHGRLVSFDVSDPVYWAGYQIYGAAGSVRLGKARQYS